MVGTSRERTSSGYSDTGLMSEYREHCFVGVLEKPYKLQTVVDLMDEVLGG